VQVQRCRGAEVQRSRCGRGAGAEVLVRRCRGGAGAEVLVQVQRCRDAGADVQVQVHLTQPPKFDT